MSTLAEHSEIQETTKKIIYWTNPLFTTNGVVDTQKMIDFLIREVPNNHFDDSVSNTWNSGEEFEVHFSDQEKKGQIIYRCTLEIRGSKNQYSVKCILCEPKEKATRSVQKTRSEEITALISGSNN